MSKKMMKRSLALGALMAFVITGSAMAADYENDTLYSQPAESVYDNINVTKDVWSVVGVDIDVTANNDINIGVDGTLSVSTTASGTSSIKLVAGNEMNLDGIILVASENSSITLSAKDIKVGDNITSWHGDTGTAKNAQIKMSATDSINVEGNINANAEKSLIELQSDDITVNGNVTANKSTASVLAKGINTINGSVIAGYEVSSGKTEINLSGNEINVDAKNGLGVVAWSAYDAPEAKVTINFDAGDDGAVNVKNATYGLMAYGNGTTVDVNAAQLNIKDSTYGMWVANRSASGGDNLDGGDRADDAKVIIGSGTDVNITNVEVGIVSMSQGTVDIAGNLEIKANGTAIDTRGEAMTMINKTNDSTKTVKIDGDIVFDYDDYKVDSGVVINLANEGSYLKGNIYNTGAGIIPDGVVTGMVIGLSNGAQWELSEASVVNKASFGNNSVLIIKDGSVFEAEKDDKGNVTTNGVYALNAAGGDSNKLSIDNTAKLQIGNIKETTYNIATGFASYEVADSIDIANNALLQANKILDVDNKTYQVKVEAKKADQMAADTGISESTAGLVQGIIENADKENKTSSEQAAVEFIQSVVDANGSDSVAVGAAINAATKMGEAGGNSATAASIVKNVTGVTNDRLSFNCGHSAPHKGGHGVGLFEEGSGADIWVEYVHGKDKVEDMPSTAGKTSYEGQYNGIVMGVDFKKVNKFQSGIAFNYGEGDTNSLGSSVRTHSDYDFWGVGYYGNIHNDDSNVIFDINYAQTDSDVTQYNSGSTLEASPETTTWSAGVKVEKLYQNENVQIVPYTGLRYMSIDADDYSTKKGEFYYSMDRQDIWLLPLGVSIRQEVANDNGWTVSPRVDLSYIWAFGDTNSNMEVKSPFPGVSQIGYDVMDDGSFLGLVGIEAHKGQWGYGVAYSYQKGDHSESKKWYVDVNYSF